jgi:hypothetical protein
MTTLIQRLRACLTMKHETALMSEAADEIERLTAENERLRVGHDRYETVRLLHVPRFQTAWLLNRKTGKPFDEIIDDLKPFVRPTLKATS